MQDSFDFLAFYSPLLQVQVVDCNMCKWWVLVPASCRPVTSRGRWGRPSCSEDCPVKVPDLLLGLSVLASEILNSQAATFREGKEPAKMGTRDDEYDYLFKGETNILCSHDFQVMCSPVTYTCGSISCVIPIRWQSILLDCESNMRYKLGQIFSI